MTTKTTPQKSSITQRLRTDLGRSVGVTTATQLVWLTGLRAHLPTNRISILVSIKRQFLVVFIDMEHDWQKTNYSHFSGIQKHGRGKFQHG